MKLPLETSNETKWLLNFTIRSMNKLLKLQEKKESTQKDKFEFILVLENLLLPESGVLAGKNIETITLEEALQAFALPRTLWNYQNEEVSASTGRFGPYIKFKNLYVSIKKDSGLDPFSITLEEAIPLIEQKIQLEANKNINEFTYEKEKIQILNWPYGPYLKFNKKNYKIPKGWKDATDLTLQDCLEIIGIIWEPKKKSWKTASKTWKTKTTTSKTTKKPTK